MSHPAAPSHRLCLIAALTPDHVIGAEGGMPWHFPADLRHFKTVTMGHPMIMGRATFESMGALPGRTSIVLTRDSSWKAEGVSVVHTLEDAVTMAAAAPGGDTIMVVGGGTVYEQFLRWADELYLTWIDVEADGDTRFPAFDEDQWRCEVLGEDGPLRWMRYHRQTAHEAANHAS